MKILFVTSNTEKLNEAKNILMPLGYEVDRLDYDFIEPYQGTMEEIAEYKLRQLDIPKNIPVFVDDSGIFFKAYNNFPGILTKRIFKLIGYKGIEKLLLNENREAYFHGVIALRYKNDIKLFNGELHGEIIKVIPQDLADNLQFPFDPIFKPKEASMTLAKMPIELRIQYSYRRIALEKMGRYLNSI